MIKSIFQFLGRFFKQKNQFHPVMNENTEKALEFLNLHHQAFFNAKPFADETEHPTPDDSRAWSQILVSLLTGVSGFARKKGADLSDGSDVKAANTWSAIDTPRFNGVIKAGTKSAHSGQMTYLDNTPYLYFVLWDNEPNNKRERCRIWCVCPPEDKLFRDMCKNWYDKLDSGEIISNNFQLHPPRGRNSDVFRNTCGNLIYPLFFSAEWIYDKYHLTHFDQNIQIKGRCASIN
jgi:hypothetical protein